MKLCEVYAFCETTDHWWCFLYILFAVIHGNKYVFNVIVIVIVIVIDAWRHQVITWISFDYLSVSSSIIILGASVKSAQNYL